MKDGLVSTSHGVQHKELFVVIATVYRLKTRQAALTQCLEQSIHLEGIENCALSDCICSNIEPLTVLLNRLRFKTYVAL